ncbi:MAG: guanylate kinase [Alphaproteobacteria bacterium]|jgi:guanylate kinase|nr:guanylate kinase [Alphaproteobacteria bacterium]
MRDAIARRGLMLVVSSPSGAGKSTLARLLLESDPLISMSVSVTTRPKRANEVDGKDYFFVSRERFEEMVHEGAFLEHATVFGNRYGTPAPAVEKMLGTGRDVLFDIDWQGAQQLAQKAKDDLVRVFILPPTRDELERRLRERAEDPPEVVAGRMAEANNEISRWSEYDYVIVNDDIAKAQGQLEAIVAAERLNRQRQIGLVDFVRRLTGD